MSNPFLDRVEKDAQSGYAGFGGRGDATPNAASAGTTAAMQQQQLEQMWQQPTTAHYPQGTPIRERAVTIDDVMAKTGLLFGALLVAAVFAWWASATIPGLGTLLWGIGLVGTLGIGIAMMFMKSVNVPLIVTYAVVEGLFVGAISQSYANVFDGAATGEALPWYQGIVFQAVLATLCVFGAMLFLYRSGLVKVTQKFRAVVSMALVGYFIFAIVNLVFSLATKSAFGIGGTGALGIGISLFAIGLAAVTLMLDFDNIETAITTGAPEKYSWILAMGLIVTLVWLYLEILRLLGRLRSSD